MVVETKNKIVFACNLNGRDVVVTTDENLPIDCITEYFAKFLKALSRDSATIDARLKTGDYKPPKLKSVT